MPQWSRLGSTLLLAGVVLGVSACESADAPRPASGDGKSTCDPAGSSATPHVREEDLADFIYHDGAFYYALAAAPPPKLGKALGRVTCTLAGSSTPQAFSTPREGLAGFLGSGTPYNATLACPSSVAIAASREGRLTLYMRQRPTNEASEERVRLEAECSGAQAVR